MHIPSGATVALFAVVLAACAPDTQDEAATNDEAATSPATQTDDVETALTSMPNVEAAAQLKQVRQRMSAYGKLETAQSAGWSMLVPNCRDNQPTGGMGWHYANPTLIDAALDPMNPEALVYEPQADGQQQLVGAEWVVPYTEHSRDSAPPALFGEQFLQNDNDQLWMLHVWLWRNNPTGMFATWHPGVSCAHAQHS